MFEKVLSTNKVKTDKIEAYLLAYRWLTFSLAFLFVCAGVSRARIQMLPGVAFLGLLLFYNLLMTFFLVQRWGDTDKWTTILVLDTTFCGILLASTGGWNSPFYLYAFNPVFLGAAICRTKGVLVALGGLASTNLLVFDWSSLRLSGILAPGAIPNFLAHVSTFALIGSFCALFLNRADELEERIAEESASKEKLLSFYQVSGAISSSFQLEEILNVVVDNAYELTKSHLVLLAVCEEESMGEPTVNSKMIAMRSSGKAHRTPELKSRIQRLSNLIGPEDDLMLLNKTFLTHRLGFTDMRAAVVVPLRHQNKQLGLLLAAIEKSELNCDDRALLKVLGGLASVAIENARLIEKTHRLMITEERNRIARDMHDGLAQSLYSLVLNLEVCARLAKSGSEELCGKLLGLRDSASKRLMQTRHYIYNLSPDELELQGLCVTLESYAKEFTSVNGVKADFAVDGIEQRLSKDEERALYYVTQEALANARRHAGAANVHVRLKFDRSQVVLTIDDDGAGLDSARSLEIGALGGGRGLANMKSRANALGGSCMIYNLADSGARVEMRIPLEPTTERIVAES